MTAGGFTGTLVENVSVTVCPTRANAGLVLFDVIETLLNPTPGPVGKAFANVLVASAATTTPQIR
ncbi:MAG TPA: hypothetical protein VGF94_08215, partial [Kofleriaceae bacterium]